jgi:preprotein translocase subunit SecY
VATNFANIAKVPELKRRIFITIMLLGIYRIGVFITTPGVDRTVMQQYMGQLNTGFFSFFNLFTGGAMEQVSIFALGIMPYISASIILSLLTVVVPKLGEWKKEGEQGQRKINQWTRYGTILLSVIQAFAISAWLVSIEHNNMKVVTNTSWTFYPLTIISLTAGTAFIMWLGETITEKGIGNGISLIIFAGIVANIPSALYTTSALVSGSGTSTLKPIHLLIFMVIMVFVIGIITFIERGQRRIPVQYAKRVVGRKVYGGQATHLPLKVNTAGVIPPIFASSLLTFPATMANFLGDDVPFVQYMRDFLMPSSVGYNVLYIALIVFFTFFYTAVQFNPADVAENMKKYGGFIPGIRPGRRTAEYIDTVLSRVTVGGAIYLATICVLPTILQVRMNLPFYFGGTSLLIVVGVALDTVSQIESHLISRHYEGFSGSKGPRIRGRRG